MRRSVYGQSREHIEEALQTAEQEWPEYTNITALVSRPTYQRSIMVADTPTEEAALWTKAYLDYDVFCLQTLKQHHVHRVNPESGKRVPQPGCLKADGCMICKHGYPKTSQLCEKPCVLCPCALQKFDLPASGRKNCLCMLHGPRDHEYLNATHPALLVGARCNSDVQLPYRLPFACSTCQEACEERCLTKQVLFAAQRAQDAQTGYSCDYCSKTQPMAFIELKELQKSHAAVAQQTQAGGLAYQGKRHMTRFMSDAYCKGIVRGHAECSNLRVYATEDAASAERITTTQYVSFPGHDLLRYAELAAKAATDRQQRVTATTLGKRQNTPKQRQVTEQNVAEFYARRPRDSPCWFLSAYEFLLYWEVVPTRVPRTWREWQERRADAWDVVLTTKGEGKLKAANAPEAPGIVRFIPGVDTKLRPELPQGYLAFEDRPENARVRSAWLLRHRRRPRCPTFGHCPIPRYQQEEQENNSFLCLVYFRPWTGMPACADRDVISIHEFRDAHMSWEATFRTWLQQIACAETKKHVSNFLSVYRVRSLAADIENSDNEGEDDTRAHVDATNLSKCLLTRATIEGTDDYRDIEAVWQTPERDPNATRQDLPQEDTLDTKAVLAEARADDKQKPQVHGGVPEPTEAAMTAGRVEESLAQIKAWLTALPKRRDAKGRRICNDEQYAFIQRVANRVMREMQTGEAYSGCFKTDEDPLRWVLHGGPGTGKTHAIRILRDELFQGLLQWEAGIHFQCAALQAVTADMLDGDTLHHAFGLSFGDTSKTTYNETKVLDKQKRLLQLRWLIIDEISMVSVELLAAVERACRALVRNSSTFKRPVGDVHSKPFGGLNVVVLGDLWQLEPPEGHFVGSVPHEWLTSKYARNKPTVAHGQELIWGGRHVGFQGMTELIQVERTQDEWLQDLQRELRYSSLSNNNNHAFLHGAPTTVPGSWLQDRVTCGNAACQALLKQETSPERILREECPECQRERLSRQLVAEGPADVRFQHHFAAAAAIFPTNVRKCHTLKVRAEAYAEATKQDLHYIIAQDKACAAVLHEKAELATEKLAWLQRHDRECGDLCGVLPVCRGMPVYLTEHVNRKRLLLKGRRGRIVSWKQASQRQERISSTTTVWNELPEVVYVHFPSGRWHFKGLKPGVYPITPYSKTWFLDRKRKAKKPMLKVSRKQLPLLPAFAMTAHQAQGQTLEEGVIADLVLDKKSNPLTAYIAITRVVHRSDLLITRPFSAEPFQRGDNSFREYLLRHLRGEQLDWPTILATYCKVKTCSECKAARRLSDFSEAQKKQPEQVAVCKECTRTYRERGTPTRCSRCLQWRATECFPSHIANFHSWARTCNMCVAKRQCCTCAAWLSERCFTRNAWKQNRDRICNACRHCKNSRSLRVTANRWRQKYQEKQRKRRAQVALDACWAEIQTRKKQRCQGVCKRCGSCYIRNMDNDITELCTACDSQSSQNSEASLFTYECPQCKAIVHSNVRDGRVDTRNTSEHRAANAAQQCGHQFTVRAGKVVNILHTYCCPHCRKTVQSSITDGQVDGRTQGCEHRFAVKNGKVVERSAILHKYRCPHRRKSVQSSITDGRIDGRTQGCEHQFAVKGGKVVESSTILHVYRCPHCRKSVQSSITDGRVDGRTQGCEHQFAVKGGKVVESSTILHVYRCPHCQKSVQSSITDGRVDGRKQGCEHQFAVKGGKMVESSTILHVYRCPHCQKSVQSSITDGRVDGRRQGCEHQFAVRGGKVVESSTVLHTYRCPHCQKSVQSSTTDGRVDGRKQGCEHQFAVKGGKVVESSTVVHTYRCPHCQKSVQSSITDGRVDGRKQGCEHQFAVKGGKVVESSTVVHTYRCPHCQKSVQSSITDGRVDGRKQGCEHQFAVKGGKMVESSTILHVYRCPHCQKSVQSSITDGRVDGRKQGCEHQFAVKGGSVVESSTVVHTYRCPHCQKSVQSSITDGRVDGRKQGCEHQFAVKGGSVVESSTVVHTYRCPHCRKLVQSSITDGQVDGRKQGCKHRFAVKDGKVVRSNNRQQRKRRLTRKRAR